MFRIVYFPKVLEVRQRGCELELHEDRENRNENRCHRSSRERMEHETSLSCPVSLHD